MLKRVLIGVCISHFVYKLWKYLKYTDSVNEEEQDNEEKNEEKHHIESEDCSNPSDKSDVNKGMEETSSEEGSNEEEAENHTKSKTDVNSNITERMNFRQHNFKLTGHFSSIPIIKENYIKHKISLLHPHDVAYLPSLKQFLVTETFYDRVGIYDESFAFQHWLPYPKKNQRFQKPTSVLSLDNGPILLLEKKGIQIFDAQLNWAQFKTGHYCGLTEGLNGDVYTLAWFKEDVCRCHIRRLSCTDNKYYWDGTVKLTVISEDFQCQESNPRFLAYHRDTIFITDTGLNRFYSANVVTGVQIVYTAHGNIPRHVAKPTGVITDDKGNILIVDRDNKRLVVYSDDGVFIKVMPNCEFPGNLQTIRKINGDYFICDRGNKSQVGGVYKFSQE